MANGLYSLRGNRRSTLPTAAPNKIYQEDPMVSPTVKKRDPMATLTSLASILGKTPSASTPSVPSYAGNTMRDAGSVRISDIGTQPKEPFSAPVIGNLPADRFASIAGLLASAIAPGTAQGRVGQAISRIGTRSYAERTRKGEAEAKLKREAPGKALDLDVKRAQLEKAKRPEKLTDWERFEKDPEAYGKFKRAGQKGTVNKYQSQIDAFKKSNPEASEWDAIVGIAKLGKEAKGGFDAAQMSAIKYINERIESGADLDEINYIAEQAGIGQFEMTETDEMRPKKGTGFWGFGQKEEPVMKITPVKDGKPATPEETIKLQQIVSPTGEVLLFNSETGKTYDKDGNEVKVEKPKEKKDKKPSKATTARKKIKGIEKEQKTALSKLTGKAKEFLAKPPPTEPWSK